MANISFIHVYVFNEKTVNYIHSYLKSRKQNATFPSGVLQFNPV